MTSFYSLVVAHIEHDTRDSMIITFDVPEAHRAIFNFHPGQFLTLRAQIGDGEVQRSYSISAGKGEKLRIGVRRQDGGVFSNWLHQALKKGMHISSLPPDGTFYSITEPEARKHYLGLAAGSGITPILGNIRDILVSEPHSVFTLVYGNRATRTIMFREELADLKNRFLERFNIIHILSREEQDVDILNGRLTGEKCEKLLKFWVDPKSIDQVLICGPDAMIAELLTSLQAHHIPRAAIKVESFGTSTPSLRQSVASTTHEALCSATIILEGSTHRVKIPKETLSILEGAAREGLNLPHSCTRGVCSTCRARLVSGKVDMNFTFALEDYEIARGDILVCQSFALTDEIILDFDSTH